jgi:nitronate monooxygenase
MTHPRIIQGGMGVAISNWRLAKTVSSLGHLGVVSGTVIDTVLARRLQCGDPGGHVRRAMAHFPWPDMAQRIVDRYFVHGGKRAGKPFKSVPMFSLNSRRDLTELTVVANFVEVFLAREGHSGPIGINLLQKVEVPTLPSLYGAMLAGAAYVLMGAGIPREIPGALDALARGDEATMRFQVADATPTDDYRLRFDPARFAPGPRPDVARPAFLAIVSSTTLAQTLLRKANGEIQGFVVEAPSAGGHNAPPRGKPLLSGDGEPVYGPRDEVDLARMGELGKPFWLAGSRARAAGLREAERVGAAGIQVGTSFALCHESGMDPALRQRILRGVMAGEVNVFTDPVASPTGFPFKVVENLPGTLAEEGPYRDRTRICDLGYLRTAYKRKDGRLGFRCPAEPDKDYLRKGGAPEELVGRKCLCNALMANIGLPQERLDGSMEQALVTCGDDLSVGVKRLVEKYGESYGAADVIADLLEPRASANGQANGQANGTAPTAAMARAAKAATHV